MQQLLGRDDPPPFSVHNEQGRSPLLLLCDHASKSVPKALGDLGIGEAELSRHIGWDIGGLDAAIALAEALDAPLVASGYSRLVIDCNRWPGGEGSTPEISDGTHVPANRGLTRDQIDARAAACFWPYHREVDRHLDRMTADVRKIALLVMHSFTPEMAGFRRPWHVGVLWNDDPRLPEPLLAELRRDTSLVVGDNEPYSARASYEYTLNAHARSRKLPHCSLEVRQDLVATPETARAWGRRLPLLPPSRPLSHSRAGILAVRAMVMPSPAKRYATFSVRGNISRRISAICAICDGRAGTLVRCRFFNAFAN